MNLELIYTSVPQGLRPGSRGFCTVAMTLGMPRALHERLADLSGYRDWFEFGGAGGTPRPIAYSHIQLAAGDRHWSVVSRIAPCGTDYSGRSNSIAHHIVLEEGRGAAGPAHLAAQRGLFRTEWREEPAHFEDPPALPIGEDADANPPAPCLAWEEASGDAGWAGELVRVWMERRGEILYVLLPPGIDGLALVLEAAALLPPESKWWATFSTCISGRLPADVTCQVRFLPATSEGVNLARSSSGATVIDLSRQETCPETPYAQAARAGLLVRSPQPSAVDSVDSRPLPERAATPARAWSPPPPERQVRPSESRGAAVAPTPVPDPVEPLFEQPARHRPAAPDERRRTPLGRSRHPRWVKNLPLVLCVISLLAFVLGISSGIFISVGAFRVAESRNREKQTDVHSTEPVLTPSQLDSSSEDESPIQPKKPAPPVVTPGLRSDVARRDENGGKPAPIGTSRMSSRGEGTEARSSTPPEEPQQPRTKQGHESDTARPARAEAPGVEVADWREWSSADETPVIELDITEDRHPTPLPPDWRPPRVLVFRREGGTAVLKSSGRELAIWGDQQTQAMQQYEVLLRIVPCGEGVRAAGGGAPGKGWQVEFDGPVHLLREQLAGTKLYLSGEGSRPITLAFGRAVTFTVELSSNAKGWSGRCDRLSAAKVPGALQEWSVSSGVTRTERSVAMQLPVQVEGPHPGSGVVECEIANPTAGAALVTVSIVPNPASLGQGADLAGIVKQLTNILSEAESSRKPPQVTTELLKQTRDALDRQALIQGLSENVLRRGFLSIRGVDGRFELRLVFPKVAGGRKATGEPR